MSLFSGRQTIRGAAPKARSNEDGGAERDRTDDLMLAKHALSQLSYSPGTLHRSVRSRLLANRLAPASRTTGLVWWAREDSNLRPHAYQACALTT